ncbi:MAG: hypothetical protein P4L50_06230 [Anaerolineaceae bacterium]|nr:hypothetical protein [Anaerolineaceae bacterium]
MTPARKRSNAFDDFPAASEGQPSSQPAAQVSEAGLQPAQPAQLAQVERIERLKPSQMFPDRFQPRHLLPGPIRQAFYSGRIDCYQAAAEWLSLSRQETSFKPELERLLAMGGSFDEHGQIKPITGAWNQISDGSYVFLIETGERRFWAACLTGAANRSKEEPLLRVEVIGHPTRQRQVLENRHSEIPSAVGQSCEIASLILAELGIQPDTNLPDEFDYFRLARTQRMPAGLWERIIPIMQLTRPRMVQLLNILQMPTGLLELADRYRLPERALREILQMPKEQWERALRSTIQNSLTSEDLAEIANPSGNRSNQTPHSAPSPNFQPGRVATSGLRRFANVLGDLDEISREQALDEVADELVGTHQAEGIMNLLDELARLVQIRLQRR